MAKSKKVIKKKLAKKKVVPKKPEVKVVPKVETKVTPKVEEKVAIPKVQVKPTVPAAPVIPTTPTVPVKKITPREPNVAAVKTGGAIINANKVEEKNKNIVDMACSFLGIEKKKVESFKIVDDNTVVLSLAAPDARKVRYEKGQKK